MAQGKTSEEHLSLQRTTGHSRRPASAAAARIRSATAGSTLPTTRHDRPFARSASHSRRARGPGSTASFHRRSANERPPPACRPRSRRRPTESAVLRPFASTPAISARPPDECRGGRSSACRLFPRCVRWSASCPPSGGAVPWSSAVGRKATGPSTAPPHVHCRARVPAAHRPALSAAHCSERLPAAHRPTLPAWPPTGPAHVVMSPPIGHNRVICCSPCWRAATAARGLVSSAASASTGCAASRKFGSASPLPP
ncbi:hypothetical protein A8924_2439 [Saccharopolyspora erythraea NRRL 2338]|nr:hypothetical protein A8924_2439 [Saccharopolyspora erythraea NRRL 2338]